MIANLQGLRWRIAAWYVGVLSLVLGILGGALLIALRRELDRELNAELEGLVAGVEREIQLGLAEGLPAGEVTALALEAFRSPNRTLVVVDSAGVSLGNAAEPGTELLEAAAAIRRGARRVEFVGASGQRWRAVGRRSDALAAPVVIVAVTDLAETLARQARRVEIVVGVGVLAIGLVALAGAQLTRVSLRPIAEAFEQRRRFLAEAAHEIRTPVALLRGIIDPAVDRPREAAADQATLQASQASVARLGRLVDHLFLLARVDAGEWPVRPVDLFLDDVISDVCAGFSALAQARGIRLVLEEFSEAPIRGDPDLVWQLAAILLDNALKFTPPGGQVTVRVRSDAGGASFSVRDTGPGMTADEASRIFDRFYRSGSARAATGGAGLGLAVAAWIAAVHGATIDVQTAPGAGSTFLVSWPAPGSHAPVTAV